MSFAYLSKQTNNLAITFKEKHHLDNRIKESETIRNKYPDRVPVIVEKHLNSTIADIDKNKFLVPGNLTMGQFAYVIRRRMKLPPEQGIFLFIRKQIIPPHFMLMSSLYKEYKDDDGFLYITYTNENTFG